MSPPTRPASPLPGVQRLYLRQFDLYRCLAFLGVVAQHAVLWPVPGGSVGGWSLVMVLHATRESFFFLSALLAGYSQEANPRSVWGVWRRRIGAILVPYLAWTAIYFVYTMATAPQPFGPAMSLLGHDLVHGYYQLYFLVVLFQVYFLLPVLVWFVRATRRHHWVVLGCSLALQLAMMGISHYASWHAGVPGTIHSVDRTLLTSRLVTGYQLYVVAGLLAAHHIGDVQRFVERHSGRILTVVAALAAATEGYYAYGVAVGQNPGHASDLFQPVAVVWFLAAIAGLTALGTRWAARAARRARREPSRWDRLVARGADVSGGVYLSHVLVLQVVLMGLGGVGMRAATSWAWVSLVLFVVTVGLSVILVDLLLRTRLRFVLTGPVRAGERSALPLYPAPAPAPAPSAVPSALVPPTPVRG
ncbi:MAG: acyltransferase [Acidimicrobiales bacterium]